MKQKRLGQDAPTVKVVKQQDRIKYWNIVPGDFVRLRGDSKGVVHEVHRVNKLSNRVILKREINKPVSPAGYSTIDRTLTSSGTLLMCRGMYPTRGRGLVCRFRIQNANCSLANMNTPLRVKPLSLYSRST